MYCAEPAAQSLDRCLDFLLRHQKQDGSWSEWDLPPGPSDGWTTAYIGYQLAMMPRLFGQCSAAAKRAAAQWLVQHQLEGGGWGYNDRVGSDADSTAYALLFLSSESVPSREGYERLIEFQQPDGGFSTYLPEEGLGSWGLSHPDVTAVAARALLTAYGRGSAEVARANEYIIRNRKEDGTWASFWWRSPMYATAMVLQLLRACSSYLDLHQLRQTLSSMAVENAFERALLIDAYMQADANATSDVVERIVRELASAQLTDGSWASAPILRLTNRDCLECSASPDAGPLFADPGRLFTSATVLRALSRTILPS